MKLFQNCITIFLFQQSGNNELCPLAQDLHYEEPLSSWNCFQEPLRKRWSFPSKRLWNTIFFFNQLDLLKCFFVWVFLQSRMAPVASCSSFPLKCLALLRIYTKVQKLCVKEKQKAGLPLSKECEFLSPGPARINLGYLMSVLDFFLPSSYCFQKLHITRYNKDLKSKNKSIKAPKKI